MQPALKSRIRPALYPPVPAQPVHEPAGHTYAMLILVFLLETVSVTLLGELCVRRLAASFSESGASASVTCGTRDLNITYK